jgi:type IV pilus assembly protein PilV
MRNEEGFSLLEVLTAIVIISFGLIGVAGMQVVATRTNTTANTLTRATTIVQDTIEELLAVPFGNPNLNDDTPVGQCQNYNEADPPSGFILSWCVDNDATGTSKTVDVMTSWHSGDDQKSFALSFVRTVFQP